MVLFAELGSGAMATTGSRLVRFEIGAFRTQVHCLETRMASVPMTNSIGSRHESGPAALI
jgi:hypothetical protein